MDRPTDNKSTYRKSVSLNKKDKEHIQKEPIYLLCCDVSCLLHVTELEPPVANTFSPFSFTFSQQHKIIQATIQDTGRLMKLNKLAEVSTRS